MYCIRHILQFTNLNQMVIYSMIYLNVDIRDYLNLKNNFLVVETINLTICPSVKNLLANCSKDS